MAGDRPARWRAGRYGNLGAIRLMDPDRDYHAIYRLTALTEFPWDVKLGLNMAFCRVFGIPSIAALLESTGEITRRTRKRAEDTGLLMYEMIDHGFGHPRGRAAVRRLNRLHQRFAISNDDYLYVLGTFIFMPARWLDRYGWRPLCCHERQAAYVFYRELGRRMDVRDIPPSCTEFEAWFNDYERQQFSRTGAGVQLMQATHQVLVARFPRVLSSVASAFVTGLLDEPLLQAVGAERSPGRVQAALHAALTARARIERFMPPRQAPSFRPGSPSSTYPDGYEISRLGPP
jgi:hypothetical protein